MSGFRLSQLATSDQVNRFLLTVSNLKRREEAIVLTEWFRTNDVRRLIAGDDPLVRAGPLVGIPAIGSYLMGNSRTSARDSRFDRRCRAHDSVQRKGQKTVTRRFLRALFRQTLRLRASDGSPALLRPAPKQSSLTEDVLCFSFRDGSGVVF